MKKDKTDRFLQGYSCCLATLLSVDGRGTRSEELYADGIGKNHTEKTLREAGVDGYDIGIFKKEGFLP